MAQNEIDSNGGLAQYVQAKLEEIREQERIAKEQEKIAQERARDQEFLQFWRCLTPEERRNILEMLEQRTALFTRFSVEEVLLKVQRDFWRNAQIKREAGELKIVRQQSYVWVNSSSSYSVTTSTGPIGNTSETHVVSVPGRKLWLHSQIISVGLQKLETEGSRPEYGLRIGCYDDWSKAYREPLDFSAYSSPDDITVNKVIIVEDPPDTLKRTVGDYLSQTMDRFRPMI